MRRLRKKHVHVGERTRRTSDVERFEVLLLKGAIEPCPPRCRSRISSAKRRRTLFWESVRVTTPPPPPAPLGGSRAPPWTDVMMTVVSRCTGLWGPQVRGSLSRRRRLQTDKSSGQQLPRECHPSMDSARCPSKPLAVSKLHPAPTTRGLAIAGLLFVVGCWLLVVGCWLLVVGCVVLLLFSDI